MASVLALLVGLGCLYSGMVSPRLTGLWPAAARVALSCVGGVCVLWGLQQVRSSWSRRSAGAGWIRHQARLPSEGIACIVIMIVLFTGSLMTDSNPLRLVFCVLASPFVLNGWITFSMLRRVQVDRELPKRVMAGAPFRVPVTLRNRRLVLACHVMSVHDRVTNDREELDGHVVFTRVPARQSRTAAYQITLNQRGPFTFGPIKTVTRFPLGLIERSYTVNDTSSVLVYPRIGRLSPDWSAFLVSTELVAQRRPIGGTFDDEFHRVREYRWGDNPRAIHWRTSARRNELMVREFQQSRTGELVVLVDLWTAGRDWRQTEYSLSFATTVCIQYAREHPEARLVVSIGGNIATEWSGLAGSRQLTQLLDQFAVTKPTTSEPASELADTLRSTPRRAAAICVTTRPPNGPGRQELEAMLARTDGEGPACRIIEATPETLSGLFQMENESPQREEAVT